MTPMLLLAFVGGAAAAALLWPPLTAPVPRGRPGFPGRSMLKGPPAPIRTPGSELARHLARELRRGHSILAAIQATIPEAEPALRQLLERIEHDFSAGAPLGHALRGERQALRTNSPLRPVLSLLIVAEERGLSPSATAGRMEQCAASLGAQERLRGEARAGTAATRASQALVAVIVPFVLVASLIQSPEVSAVLLHSAEGRAILLAVLLLEALAVLIGRQVTKVPEL